MYCTDCGGQNETDSIYCQYCGYNIESATVKINPPYIVSSPKILLLSFFTLGIYNIYWFYRHWQFYKTEMGLKYPPLIGALFSPLSSYLLFHAVYETHTSLHKIRKYNPAVLALVYFIFMIFYFFSSKYWWLGLASVIPLIPVQNLINNNWKSKGSNSIKNSTILDWTWILLFLPISVLLISLYGSSDSSQSTNKSTTNTVPQGQRVSKGYSQSEIVPSVVNILCSSTVSGEEDSGGSGTIISEEGLILTNSHIIPQDEQYINVGDEGCVVVLPDPTTGQPQEMYLAKPIVIPGLSDKYDLAFVEIYSAYFDEEEEVYLGTYPRKFPAFDDTSRCLNEQVTLGETVTIFGYPAISGGYSLTVTDGVVSSFPGDGLIVTSAKISHGNSGGLAIDKNGCMLGVPSLVSYDNAETLGVIYSMELVEQFTNEVIQILDDE